MTNRTNPMLLIRKNCYQRPEDELVCDSSAYVSGRKTYSNVYIDDRGGLPCVYRMLDKLITKIENGGAVYE